VASIGPSLIPESRLGEILAHLPPCGMTEYGKGHIIYSPNRPSPRLYLEVRGIVVLSEIAEGGAEVLVEFVLPNELFGESAFLSSSRRSERAVALEGVTVMSWAVADMEGLVMDRPNLAMALLQVLAQRNAELTRHIESMAVDTTERRLARSLLRFSERLGRPQGDGSVRIMPLTHEMLSRYIGTTREVVTKYMNRFRKLGYVSYSRRGILLYCEPMRSALASNVPRSIE
jgi:CRP/FNR family cyclic AMP-dependent transcriptional regulator